MVMLFSAAKLLPLLLMTAPQAAQQASNPVWLNVKPSIIYIQGRSGVIGTATLIDDQGLFLAHSSAIETQQVKAKFDDGKTLSLFVLNNDPHTQLTLLQATYWEQGARKVIKVAEKPTTSDIALLAVTASGPKIGEFIAEGKAGMMKPSLRYVPLSEVRLNANVEKLGGAMVFDDAGDLIGVLGATLVSSQKTSNPVGDLRSGFASGGGGRSQSEQSLGPRNMTVAYALGREVLQRVVTGFKSLSRQVQHPSIGLFFKANLDGRGVLVESVLAGSPSALAGLQPGDVILDINDSSVNSPIELAVVLFRQKIGDTIRIRYQRGVIKGTKDVTVESNQTSLGLKSLTIHRY